MSPDIIILLLGLVALMALGIPICFAMMSVASVILLVFYGSGLLNVLNAAFVYQMQSESLLAIPMFALMAAFLQTSGIGGDIYEFFHKWLGGINGGLAMATVATTAVIAAMSGVAATATIMMGLIALPAMLDRGYDKALATGPVLAGGCLGPIIPPSTIMIIMSSYTGVSAGWLFAGGALPGVGLALLFIIYIGIRCAINPKLGPGIPKAERPSWGEKMRVFKKVIAPIAIIVLVLGCIYAGIATPTEAAGVGAFASMVYALITRKLNVKNLRASLIQTMEVSAMLMWILMGGAAYNSLVNITRLSDVVAAAFASSNLDGLPLMLLSLCAGAGGGEYNSLCHSVPGPGAPAICRLRPGRHLGVGHSLVRLDLRHLSAGAGGADFGPVPGGRRADGFSLPVQRQLHRHAAEGRSPVRGGGGRAGLLASGSALHVPPPLGRLRPLGAQGCGGGGRCSPAGFGTWPVCPGLPAAAKEGTMIKEILFSLKFYLYKYDPDCDPER